MIVRELGCRDLAFYVNEPMFPDDAQALLSQLCGR
jgi:hypothetical protein